MTEKTEWLGWHWLPDDGLTSTHVARNGRTRKRIRVEPGQTLKVRSAIRPCESGLHASKRALDALRYAPGSRVQRVRLSGTIVEEADKAAASERTCLWVADATHVLHEFACWCAEQALLREREQGREPDPRSWTAIEAKCRWLRKEITDAELAAAWNAAWAAAQAAPWAAAWAVAQAAPQAAPWAAPWGAAAWAATWAAARDAARAAAWAATWAAAQAAARDAAWDAQNAELERRLWALEPEREAEPCDD
jgi:hypothetical protein